MSVGRWTDAPARPGRWLRLRKRAADIALGSLLSVLVLPVLALLTVGTLISLRSNPFFVQWRYGYRGKPFRVIKLRTLAPSTPTYANKHAIDIANMPLPRFCALLRRTHLDELPQIFLVPLGRMSLVGPRPRMCNDVEVIERHYDEARTSVRPGCTGIWQISVAHEGTATGAPRFDLFYLRHASARLDVWILLRTLGWFAGAVKPIDLYDIPRWTLGPGLAPEAMAVVSFSETLEPVASRNRGDRRLIGTRPPIFLGDTAEID